MGCIVTRGAGHEVGVVGEVKGSERERERETHAPVPKKVVFTIQLVAPLAFHSHRRDDWSSFSGHVVRASSSHVVLMSYSKSRQSDQYLYLPWWEPLPS